MTKRTYNKLWLAYSGRSVPNQPRFSPRRNNFRGRCGRQIPAVVYWGRCHRMPMIPRSLLSWQCYSSSNPEVLSIGLRPNTNGRLSVLPDYRRRPRTLAKHSDDPPRSQVFPDPLSLPPPAYLCNKARYIHPCRYKFRASSKVRRAPSSL